MKKYIIISALMLATLSFNACTSKSSTNTTSNESAKTEKIENEHSMINVQGACDMCKNKIETAAKGVDGVSSATWDKADKVLHLNFDPSKTNVDAIGKALANVGYDNDKHKAEDSVYNALPECCKYR